MKVGDLFDLKEYTNPPPFIERQYYGGPLGEDLPPDFWDSNPREEIPIEYLLLFADYIICQKCQIGLSPDDAATGVCPGCSSWVYLPVPAPDQSPTEISGNNGKLKFLKKVNTKRVLPRYLERNAYCETCNIWWREDELSSEPICPECGDHLILP